MDSLKLVILVGFASQVVAGPITEFLRCATETESKPLRSGFMRSFGLYDERECFSSCLMKSIGVLDANGKISPDRIMDIVQKHSTDSVAVGKGKVVVLRCGTEGNSAHIHIGIVEWVISLNFYILTANAEKETCATVLTFNKCVQEAVWENPKSKTLPEFNITLPPITLVLAFLSLL
ncbi:uncharacterized protein LOC106665187 isoform X2 [Cimex lectularius]|uniref:Odorant binding protein n=1 Tax=Cimex lectularius TaxID=79782 RepID=A0A8I6RN19_CIMLE|nr:uncharacterized protein LOC106665187 isoform X2 [Cimex lectularius]